jgi:transcriptional regulator with XRE-family HTH domain
MGQNFGALLKGLRLERGLTLRKFCKYHGYDPGNISKMERGKLSPPANTEQLRKLAFALNLEENSDKWQDFMIIAAVETDKIPKPILENEEIMEMLPVLFRTMTGEKISPDKLDLLIKILKEE